MSVMSRAIALATVFFASGSAGAADYALAIGGGPEPQQSQVSLEENLVYFQSVLPKIGWDQAKSIFLFGAADKSRPDVCFRQEQTPDLNSLLSDIFNQGAGVDLAFRPNRISADGPATKSEILKRLRLYSETLSEGDRLLLYVTGHGGKGTPVANGYLHAWGGERLYVRELAAALDRFDPEVEALLVMVQCYSGSFANIIYSGGDEKQGLAPHRRSGFFATVENRPAAGCTPDLDSSKYEEYSTYFWAALSGADRRGIVKGKIDLDRNDTVTAPEAHAHALIAAPTIDISMRASDLLLRQHAPDDPRNGRLFRFDRDYSRLASVASPAERAVLENLSKQLALGGESRIAEASRKLESVEYDQLGLREDRNRLITRRNSMRQTISEQLLQQWPSLKNPWHPQNARLLENEGDAILNAIRHHPDFDDYEDVCGQLDSKGEQDRENQRTFALLQRFIRTAQSVALAQNLRIAGKSEFQEKHRQLVDLEESFFTAPRE